MSRHRAPHPPWKTSKVQQASVDWKCRDPNRYKDTMGYRCIYGYYLKNGEPTGKEMKHEMEARSLESCNEDLSA